MKTQANGIGSYKRRKSPSGSTAISPERQARMDAAHRICQGEVSRERAQADRAAAVYRAGQAGLAASSLEVAA